VHSRIAENSSMCKPSSALKKFSCSSFLLRILFDWNLDQIYNLEGHRVVYACVLMSFISVMYRVRMNYRGFCKTTFLEILNRNTWSYYHLKEECLQFHSDLTCIRCAPLVWHVTQDMLERVWRKWEYRLDICPVTRGAHIEWI